MVVEGRGGRTKTEGVSYDWWKGEGGKERWIEEGRKGNVYVLYKRVK